MKPTIILICFFLLLSHSIKSQWVYIEGTGGNVTCFAKNGTSLFAVSEGNGIFRSTDGGTNWTPANSGLTDGSVYCMAVNSTNIFAGTDGGHVFRSTNNGDSWTIVFDGSPFGGCTSLAVSGQNIFAGYSEFHCMFCSVVGRVFFSANNGESWDTTNYVGTGVSSLYAIETKLYLFRGAGETLVSTDNGTIWTPVGSGLEGRSVYSMLSSDTNHFAATDTGLYLSTDNDTNWALAGMIGCSLSNLVTNGTNLFAMGNCGDTRIFVIDDNGLNWTCISYDGFYSEEYYFFPITIEANEIYLFAGCCVLDNDPGGVYRRLLSNIYTDIQNIEVPRQFLLLQNYPNPFKTSTTIKFELPVCCYVTLKVYNLLGREVATLVNEKLDAGLHTAIWNANGVASGTYIYKFQVGEYSEVNRLVLME